MAKLIVDLSGQSVKLPENLKKQEPTHVARYWIIAQIIKSVHKNNPNILDVGGKEGLLRSFGFTPTVIDTEPSKEPKFILGNALNMPFKDKEFDISVSCDVLEHIEKKDRNKFISEMLRVSRIAIVCAPFEHAGMKAAEVEINEYYKSLLSGGHRWLQEHIDNGLPSEAETGDCVKMLGYKFIKVRHFSINIWTKILKAHLLHAAFGDSKDLVYAVTKLYENYYQELCSFDYSEEAYRTFFVISKDDLSFTLPSKAEINLKKEKFMSQLLDIFFEASQKQALSYRKTLQMTGKLKTELNITRQKFDQLNHEMQQIKSSKVWQAAQGLNKVKRLGRR